ncbi:hypothetical protein ACKWTF_009667 [Chironomus riparius]
MLKCFKLSDGNTSFLRAARAGNLEKVLEHLKNNIDINTCNANGLNALHLASKDGHISVVSELLSRGAIVDAATKKGNTALHIASLAGQEEVVKLLIQHNASVNVQSQNGFTPLYMAAQENHDSVVKLLLANGANQSLATEDGFTPLAVAMQQGHDKVVAVLLESDTRGKVRLPALHIAAKKDDVKAASLLLENDHNPDVTSKSGFTPLHIASHYGNEGIANLLIQKGADVNYAAKHNITPLHVAAKWGKTNMVALLLDKGANIESKTRDGLTPLHCAARSGHEQVVDMLLERGAPISSKTKNGLAPLHMAAQGEHVDAARILLYHRAPVDEVTVDYLTALHVAAHCGHVRVAKLLLDRNADANARALNGFTPLHIACKKNRIKVVELLLKHGASIGATTESGLTPLHVASFMGCMNIVIYLLQHDASPDVPTVRGETPLHLAARANQTDIIRILLRNGAQVDARAREQQTPLHIASRLGNVDIVMLLLQHGAQVDAVTKDMYTALHIAAKEGQDEVAAVLLDNGAQIDTATKKGFTPLHLTAKYGNIKVAQLLLSKDAPVDAQGKNGVTPLHVASHYDHQNVALLLLEKGASPHATAKNGHTPLHIAARKNQMDIATTLLEYGALANAESKAGFTPLHLSSQEGHTDMSSLLLEHKADADHQARNGLTPLHLCAQEDKVQVAQILVKHGANISAPTKAGYTPLHVASHFGQANMVRYLIEQGAEPNSATGIGYTPLHQAAQQGHLTIVQVLVENKADPNLATTTGQTPLHIAQKLGYISVYDSLKPVTDSEVAMTTSMTDEKYRVVAPEAMHETFMSDSEEEGEDTALSDQPYRYLTVDEMKSLGDDSLPIDVTRDERVDNKMISSIESTTAKPPQALEDSISPQHVSMQHAEAPVGHTVTDYAVTSDNIVIDRHPQHVGKLHWKNFLVSFLVDARGGAMRGCRHSGVRIIVPARSAAQPTRITCRYVKPQRTMHPPPLMEGEALASRVLELGPVGAKFLGPVIMEVPHFASLRGKEREIVILRSDNGETWREHTIENSEEIVSEVLNDCFEPEDIAQMDELGGGRICRFVTYDFPQYFAVISRIHQEVHAIGPEGGMVSSTVVPQVQAVFPQGALTKKIKVGLQAQPIDPELTAKLLGRGVAVSPVVTVEPRRRKFHKAITLSIPTPRAHSQGMINQYSGNAPTLRLLCSITGGTTRAQWEDVTGSTPLTFVNDCVSFTTTVSARFWLMDCRNIADATKMATELYKEAIHVPFMAKFVVFAKRVDPMEARLRVFCMTDDREDKTLEQQENFSEVAKSRDVEVLENKIQYLELAGNLIPVTKSGEQLQFPFKAFKENRLPFSARVKDQHADTVGRALFMREPKVAKGEQPQSPICILNIVLPEDIIPEQISVLDGSQEVIHRIGLTSHIHKHPDDYMRGAELRMSDVSNHLGDDWIKLAPEIGMTEQEVEDIIENYSNSTAQQAQAMLKLFQSKKQNDLNILENGLRSIGRDDIVERCLIRKITTTTTTTTVTKRQHKRSSDTNGYEESDLIKDSESLEDLNKKRYGRYEHDESKYSAEEKVVESEEDEIEAAKRSVAERREKIEKRLSGEQKHFPSSQHKELVEEIITIKRQSLIEDAVAKHEDEILMQKPIDNSYKSSTVPEQVVKLKTTSHDSSSVDKSDFEKELHDKFQKTLGDVEKFEHKFTHEAIPVTMDFLASEIHHTTVEKDIPEKTITSVSKTTTVTETIPDEILIRKESPVVKKREVITTTTTTSSDGDCIKQTTTQIYDQGDDITDEFERIEREVMDPALVDEILEEARQKADNIQSKVVTNTTTTVHPGETKEIITTTTTIRTIESINLDDVSGSRLDNYDDEEELIQNKKTVESTQKPTITPPPTPLDGRSSAVQQLPDEIKFDKFGVESAEEHDSDSAKELQSHQTSTSTEARQLPKPTPRLNKSSTNDTYNSSLSSNVDDSSTSSASHTLKSDIESEISDVAKTEDFKQKKQFWENFDHPIMPVPMPRPRIAKSQRDSKDSFETETSSLRSSKEISRDEEERLEDQSFPITDRYDSDASDKAVIVSTQKKVLITDMDKIDSIETSELGDDGLAKFYIGESSTNVIRKSANEKRAEFAFDNQGYEYSIDTDETKKHQKRDADDFINQDIEIYDDSLLSKDSKEANLVRSMGDEMDSKMDLILDEKSEFEMSEKLSRQQSEEMDPIAVRPQVIHSPIKNVTILEMEKPLEIAEQHITVAKASAVEVLKDFSEPKKPIKLETIPDLQMSKESLRLDTANKKTEEEIEKTLEEVEDSLSAVQDELIGVVKDGKLINQSPSEFEIKILPDLKYPASIPEQEELPDTPKKEPFIKIKEPEKYEKPKQSETEESQQSSNEDSFNKLDVAYRQKSKSSSNRWSATDIESSSESHYQSFEKSDSRPLSSDVENQAPYQSSEYETAHGQSIVSGSTLDYQSAVSTLNSRDSMKSLDSESSGNLASIETSEASETLVPSTMDECDEALLTDIIAQELESDDKDRFTSLESEGVTKSEDDSSAAVHPSMKRSHEMTFTECADPIAKFEETLGKSVEDLKYGSWEEPRFGSSLEEGSMLSVSISSASNLETMVEIHSDHADQLMGSLVGSYDSAKIFTSFTDDAVGSTPPEFERIESRVMTSVQEDDASTQMQSTDETEPMKKRGHKRTDSTSVFASGFVKAESKESGSDSFEEDIIGQEDSSDVISSEKDETHGESSDSEYDRYESEYARAYRLPISSQSKSKGKEKSADTLDEKKFSSPGHSIIETIVEDVHAETEQSSDHVTGTKKLQDYEIPDIEVTQDITLNEDEITLDVTEKAAQNIQYAKQVEYKMSEEEYQELLDKKYASRLADLTKTYDDNIYDEQQPSPAGSDSFEMLNEPDISDEFVIVEEVAKEAHEFDQEGKSVSIQSKKYITKHDEEMEKYVVRSAPAATDAGSFATGFEFEESPPQDDDNGEEPLRGNGYSLEGRKGWVEMNLSDPANLRYPYEIDSRGVLEDIKEEDTDFEVGSSRISSFKDSYSSTPDYDALVRRIQSREHDNLSMNSLQEFESLERVISLENRQKHSQSSQESLSNGSYPKREVAKSIHGDDISLSSLKEFEGLENACIEAHLIEIRAKEEAALLLSRSDDSNKSSGSSSGAKSSPKTASSSPGGTKVQQQVTTSITTSTVVKGKQTSSLEQQMAHEFQKLQQRAQEIMEDKSISIMETSTDSLEDKAPRQIYDRSSSQHVSSDSLDKDLKSADPMTSSVDSIEMSRGGGERTGKSSDVDSIEQTSPIKRRSDSIDSIEMLIAANSSGKMDRDSFDDVLNFESNSGSSSSKKTTTKTITSTGVDGQSVTTTVTSTTVRYDMPQHKDISNDSLNARTEPDMLLTSTESLTSSTATNATYQNETDSQMSGSITSCGSTTMIEMDPTTSFFSPSSSTHHITSTTTTTYSYHDSDLPDDDFKPITFTVKKSNQ